MEYTFTKMHGLGNCFILMDDRWKDGVKTLHLTYVSYGQKETKGHARFKDTTSAWRRGQW